MLAVGDEWTVFQVTEGPPSCHHPFGVFSLPEGAQGGFCTLEAVGLYGQHKWVQLSSFLSSVYCGTCFHICVIIFFLIFEK